jgi:hypothetical protein
MNPFARVGVALLAIYWGIRGVIESVEAVTRIAGSWTNAPLPSDGLLATLGGIFLFSLLVAVIPAWLLYLARTVIADRVAPHGEWAPSLAIRGPELLAVGCLLLAILLALRGVTGILSSTTLLLTFLWSDGLDLRGKDLLFSAVSLVLSGMISLAAGWLLWRHARALAGKTAQ